MTNHELAADVAEVRRGRWIDVEHKLLWCEDDVEVVSHCFLCGSANCLGETPFCPNCGADMRGAGNA